MVPSFGFSCNLWALLNTDGLKVIEIKSSTATYYIPRLISYCRRYTLEYPSWRNQFLLSPMLSLSQIGCLLGICLFLDKSLAHETDWLMIHRRMMGHLVERKFLKETWTCSRLFVLWTGKRRSYVTQQFWFSNLVQKPTSCPLATQLS